MASGDIEGGRRARGFQVGRLYPGDIVFVLTTSGSFLEKVKRSINVTGQRVLAAVREKGRIPLDLDIPPFSHVMLGIGGGAIIHADGKRVEIETADKALRYATGQQSVFEIYRPAAYEQATAEKIAGAAIRYYQQNYAFLPALRRGQGSAADNRAGDDEDTTQFCSRLVAHAYRANGLPLSHLADEKVLPVDLYLRCQDSSQWHNITSEFDRDTEPLERLDDVIGTISVEGVGELTPSEFMQRTDELLAKQAGLHLRFHKLRYKVTQDQLATEGLLGQYIGALFQATKAVYLRPQSLDQQMVDRICKVLSQLDRLLALSLLPNIDDVLAEDDLSRLGDGVSDRGLFVGQPAPEDVRGMQRAGEKIRVYTYYLMADLGLLVLCAHAVPADKFEPYRVVPGTFAQQFYEALSLTNVLESYGDTDKLFPWASEGADRGVLLGSFTRIMQCIAILRLLTPGTSAATPAINDEAGP